MTTSLALALRTSQRRQRPRTPIATHPAHRAANPGEVQDDKPRPYAIGKRSHGARWPYDSRGEQPVNLPTTDGGSPADAAVNGDSEASAQGCAHRSLRGVSARKRGLFGAAMARRCPQISFPCSVAISSSSSKQQSSMSSCCQPHACPHPASYTHILITLNRADSLVPNCNEGLCPPGQLRCPPPHFAWLIWPACQRSCVTPCVVLASRSVCL
jgi:hypothetical protein